MQRCLDPARCVPELRACSSGVFFASAAFGSFLISKVPVLSGMAQKVWPQHNIIAVVHFHFSPADRMAETRPYSNLGVEIKIRSEAGLINFFSVPPEHLQTNYFPKITDSSVAPFQHLQKL